MLQKEKVKGHCIVLWAMNTNYFFQPRGQVTNNFATDHTLPVAQLGSVFREGRMVGQSVTFVLILCRP